jgi:uncharacterized OB-fold protein
MSKTVQENLWKEGPEGPALIGSRCEDCGAKAFPARRICPRCHSAGQSASALSRRGKIYSFTRIFIKSPVVAEVPYAVGYVLLEDGITVPARLVGPGETLKIGLPVVLEAGMTGKEPGDDENSVYCFKLEETGGEIK